MGRAVTSGGPAHGGEVSGGKKNEWAETAASAGSLKFNKAGRARASLGPSGSLWAKAERSPEGRRSGDGAAQAFAGMGESLEALGAAWSNR